MIFVVACAGEVGRQKGHYRGCPRRETDLTALIILHLNEKHQPQKLYVTSNRLRVIGEAEEAVVAAEVILVGLCRAPVRDVGNTG